MGDGPFTDADSGIESVLVGESIMNSTEESTVGGLEGSGGKTWELASDTRERIRARGEGDLVGAVKRGEHSGCRTTEGAVTRCIAWK